MNGFLLENSFDVQSSNVLRYIVCVDNCVVKMLMYVTMYIVILAGNVFFILKHRQNCISLFRSILSSFQLKWPKLYDILCGTDLEYLWNIHITYVIYYGNLLRI